MRSNLELWEVVRDNFDSYWDSQKGLCYVILKLWSLLFISSNEKNILFDEINEYGDSREFFLGQKGNMKPRKEFIEKMIKKHKNIL